MSGLNINDLTGIQNIPGIKQIQRLDLSGNRISIIPFYALQKFSNLQILSMSENLIQVIEQRAFSSLIWLKEAYFISAFDESITSDKKQNILDRLHGLETIIAPGIDLRHSIRFYHP